MYYNFRNQQTVSALPSYLSTYMIHLLVVAAIIVGGFAHYTNAFAQSPHLGPDVSALKCESTKISTICYDNHSTLVIDVPLKHGPVQIYKRPVLRSEIKLGPNQNIPSKTEVVGYIVTSVSTGQVISSFSDTYLTIRYTYSGFTPAIWHANQWTFPYVTKRDHNGPELAGHCC